MQAVVGICARRSAAERQLQLLDSKSLVLELPAQLCAFLPLLVAPPTKVPQRLVLGAHLSWTAAPVTIQSGYGTLQYFRVLWYYMVPSVLITYSIG